MRVSWKPNMRWGFSECDLPERSSQVHRSEKSKKGQRKKAEQGWGLPWSLTSLWWRDTQEHKLHHDWSILEAKGQPFVLLCQAMFVGRQFSKKVAAVRHWQPVLRVAEMSVPVGKGILDRALCYPLCICILEHLQFVMLCWVSLNAHVCIPQGHYGHVVIANDSM